MAINSVNNPVAQQSAVRASSAQDRAASKTSIGSGSRDKDEAIALSIRNELSDTRAINEIAQALGGHVRQDINSDAARELAGQAGGQLSEQTFGLTENSPGRAQALLRE
ncbi:MAG: hypothetical protein HOL85_16045 [Rhodospirillaceae bacterium]|jgi:hypothetical protein|nr:hypothetical protein [Rhodospirillaceae bacterium]MBT6140138.1 hypothetical protein [Rhodospirillaceae bacterium]